MTYVYFASMKRSRKFAQKWQMDFVIIFWDHSLNQVSTHYLKSIFLGHASAYNLEEKFPECLSRLSLRKLVQISMDLLTTSFFIPLLTNNRPAASDPQLLNLSSCGLHVLDGAFQIDQWSVNGQSMRLRVCCMDYSRTAQLVMRITQK